MLIFHSLEDMRFDYVCCPEMSRWKNAGKKEPKKGSLEVLTNKAIAMFNRFIRNETMRLLS